MQHSDIVKTLSDLKHRVFPRPFERLAVQGAGLVGVEVGVYAGLHAESLLTHLDMARLYLVDAYRLYDEYAAGRAVYGVTLPALDEARAAADLRLAPYADRITWLRRMAADAAQLLPDGLDFAYLDANHEEGSVSAELATYWRKVRPGGVLGGHDFYNGFRRTHDGVVRAVPAFAAREGATLQVELPDWWITKPAEEHASCIA